MSKKKYLLSAFMALSIFNSFSFADDSIKVNLNGSKIFFDVQPTIIEGRTVVPVKQIFEALGLEVGWNGETRTVTGTGDEVTVKLTINNKQATVNGKIVKLDVPATIIDGRTFVPAKFVAEATGAKVGWDGSTKTVLITSNDIVDYKEEAKAVVKFIENEVKLNPYAIDFFDFSLYSNLNHAYMSAGMQEQALDLFYKYLSEWDLTLEGAKTEYYEVKNSNSIERGTFDHIYAEYLYISDKSNLNKKFESDSLLSLGDNSGKYDKNGEMPDDIEYYQRAYNYLQNTSIGYKIKQKINEFSSHYNVSFSSKQENLELMMYRNQSGDYVSSVDFKFDDDELNHDSQDSYIQVRVNDGNWKMAYFNNWTLIFQHAFWDPGIFKVEIRPVINNVPLENVKTINVTVIKPEAKYEIATINSDNTIHFPKGGLGIGYNWSVVDSDLKDGFYKDGITLDEAKKIKGIELWDEGRANTPIFTIQGIQFMPNLKKIYLTNWSGLTEDLNYARELGIEIVKNK